MQSLFLNFLIIIVIVYFNFITASMAQDLYEIDEDFFKRNERYYPTKKDTIEHPRDIRKQATGKPKNQDSHYADDHINFDTLSGIGLGKRSPSPGAAHFNFDTLGGIGLGKRAPSAPASHFNFDTLGGIGFGKRSRTSRFAQARNAIDSYFGRYHYGATSTPVGKRFLNQADIAQATGYRPPKQYGKKKYSSFPFLWLN